MTEERRPAYDELIEHMKQHPWKTIYFLVSGGRDSTAMFLEAWKIGVPGIMVFQETMLERSYGRKTVEQLAKLTQYPLLTVRYDGERKPSEILDESFMQLLEVLPSLRKLGDDNKITYDKSKFDCCKILKKKPMQNWLKSHHDKENSIMILGIKGADGSTHRRINMAQIRKQNTHFRTMKTNGFTYYYPLRDMGDKMVQNILDENGFSNIRPTGCAKCPVFCIFPGMIQRDRMAWLRSVSHARKLGIPLSHTYKEIYQRACTGVVDE